MSRIHIKVHGELLDTKTISVRGGHGSPGNDLYIDQGTMIKRLDPDLGYELASFDVNHTVSGICLDPGSNTVYVSSTGGSVVSLDGSTLSLQDSVSIDYGVSFLCHVPEKENLYLGIRSNLNGDKIIVLDLPGLDVINEITIPEGLMDMVADPSGDYVYCSINYAVDL